MSERAWRHLIDGESRDGTGGDVIVVENPATAEPIGEVPIGTADDVDTAVKAAARAGREDWARLPASMRAAALSRIAAQIRDHADEVAALETAEVGKPYTLSRFHDVVACALNFDYFAGMAGTFGGRTMEQGPVVAHTVPEPYGVVGVVYPFNWPPIFFGCKIAPALLTGNTVVVKPPPQAPLSTLLLTELVQEFLPPGVINVVTGDADTGRALVSHPEVRKITFTGSSPSGRAVAGAAAEHLAPVSLELGGKNAFVIFDDADLDRALGIAVEAAFLNQGEACAAASRLLVHASVHDEFVSRLAEIVTALRLGDGMDSATDLGPMIDGTHRDRVRSFIDEGSAEGATVMARGAMPDDSRLARGYFVEPILFTDVQPAMRIAQEEIFGPVLAVLRFESDDEAMEIVNGNRYGLIAAAFTEDQGRAQWFVRNAETGVVFVNNYFRAWGGMPFGGTKDSGYGREGSAETLSEYFWWKHVRVPAGPEPVPGWRPGVMRAGGGGPPKH